MTSGDYGGWSGVEQRRDRTLAHRVTLQQTDKIGKSNFCALEHVNSTSADDYAFRDGLASPSESEQHGPSVLVDERERESVCVCVCVCVVLCM